MIHTYEQNKRASQIAVDKARSDMEVDVYSKKMIYKMSRGRVENSKDVKCGTLIKDIIGKLLTEQEALNHERNNNDLDSPSYVEGKVELTDITVTEM